MWDGDFSYPSCSSDVARPYHLDSIHESAFDRHCEVLCGAGWSTSFTVPFFLPYGGRGEGFLELEPHAAVRLANRVFLPPPSTARLSLTSHLRRQSGCLWCQCVGTKMPRLQVVRNQWMRENGGDGYSRSANTNEHQWNWAAACLPRIVVTFVADPWFAKRFPV